MKWAISLFFALTLISTASAQGQDDPRYTSWLTSTSGTYARLYESTADLLAGTAVTTWTRGQGTQSQPTYAGVSEISYSGDWVYIRGSGLGFHTMGPWYLNTAKTRDFPNYPANNDVLYRIPRTPTVPTNKTITNPGAIGYFVDGVAMFDYTDTFSYSTSNAADASPVASFQGRGDGVWNRDAYVNEGVTFDPALAHQAGSFYHYHANAPALRYQLGDHVAYDESTRTYTESTGTASHSPIVAWAADGYPVYGPYGYDHAADATSTVRRMISGYIKRDGSFGSTNLNSTGRTTLPPWATIAQGISSTLNANRYGPTVSTDYVLGHYLEDYDYLGDLGQTQGTDFDLDLYNGRFCVTPEFPNGTYAYFLSVEVDGTPKYPYIMGRWFFGDPTGESVNSITETVVQYARAAPTADLIVSVAANGSQVDVAWNSVEGASYTVETSANQSLWTTVADSLTSNGITTTYSADEAAYFRVTLSSIDNYDTSGTAGTAVGSSGIAAYVAETGPENPNQVDSAEPISDSDARISNLSTRTRIGGEAGTPIIGFVIDGTGAKSLIARSVGPTLGEFGITNFLADPSLSLQRTSDGEVVASNDDWHLATNREDLVSRSAVLGAFTLLDNSADAAWLGELPAAGYTAPIPSVGDNGIVLLEIYDAGGSTDTARLTNASTRAWAGPGDDVLISGFVLAGNSSRTLLLRAVGPGLTNFGVSNALSNPVARLFSGDAEIAVNDNWGQAANTAAILSAANDAGAFALTAESLDAALLVDLAPGAYTLQVSDAGSENGTALVEIYLID